MNRLWELVVRCGVATCVLCALPVALPVYLVGGHGGVERCLDLIIHGAAWCADRYDDARVFLRRKVREFTNPKKAGPR